MATISSNIARIHASLPGLRTGTGAPVTSGTQRLEFPYSVPTLRSANLLSFKKEPADARLTGGTRSLERRLLALNLAPFAKAKPVRSVSAPERMAAPMQPTAA
jgi:hypothetical protein